MSQQWDEQSLDRGGVFGSKRCTHHPGMHHVGGDDCLIEQRCGLQPPGQLVGEQDVGELGLVVGLGAGVVPFTLEVSEVDAPLSMRVGRNRDHSGRRAVPQPVEEQVSEEERRKVVNGEGAFEAVGGDMPGVPVPAHVVDQHIDSGKALKYLVGQPPHLSLDGQVSDQDVYRPAARDTDLSSRALGPLAVSADDREMCTHGGQTQGSGLADATAATGDQHRLARHRPALYLLHVE
jgi:hypothetical protein